METKEKLVSWLTLVNTLLEEPRDGTQLKDWLDAAEELSDGFDIDQDSIDILLNGYEASYSSLSSSSSSIHADVSANTISMPLHILDELCARPQIVQRSPEWYVQAYTTLTASELGSLLGSPRSRAQLILSKVNPVARPSKSLAIPTLYMNAMDWGVRFEPVVKQLYEYKYSAAIRELGRIVYREDERCAASPDGLIYTSNQPERIGRLIEIKCPVTRQPDGKVPKDYYAQIQMQLRVTNLSHCDFVEVVFDSPYSHPSKKVIPPITDTTFHGEILLVQSAEDGNTRYEYGPVQIGTDFTPFEYPGVILERIPWRLLEWHEQIVVASESWWTTTKPIMDAFWVDVERAKVDSSFLDIYKKNEVCLIRIPTNDTPDSSEPAISIP